MTHYRIGRTGRLYLIGTALALTLSACGSSGSTRIASIGDVPGDTAGTGGSGDTDGGGGSNTGDGSGANTGGGNTGGGNTGGGNTGSGNTGGSPGGGNTSGSNSSVPIVGPVLVTAGNAVIGLGDKHAGLANTVNGKLPVARPITGTVTAVLRKSGQTLVDLGNGQSAVLNRAGGSVGRLVTIDLGTGRVVGAPGATALIGVAALTPTQLASASLANPAGGTITPVVGGVLGKVGTIASGTTGATGLLGGPAGSPSPQPATLPPLASVTGGVLPAVTGTVNGALPGVVGTVGGVLGKAKGKLGK